MALINWISSMTVRLVNIPSKNLIFLYFEFYLLKYYAECLYFVLLGIDFLGAAFGERNLFTKAVDNLLDSSINLLSWAIVVNCTGAPQDQGD